MYKEVMKWLRMQHMPVAESHLRLRLESHPDYPSLIAVQDTLEELGINSYACNGTKEELKKENKPFLAHFNMGEGYVLFFKDVATAEKKVKDFDTFWSGSIMFADPIIKYGNMEHDKLYKKEKLNSSFGIAAIILFIGAFLGVAIASGSLPAILLTISNFIGLCFSWLIAQKEFGISNGISDKICSMAKHSLCESVLFSKSAKLFNWLTWGDVGIVYFTSSLLYILISQITNQLFNLEFYYLLSLAGIAFPLYSLYYQWKVVKQWCMLCIGVLTILGINSIIGLTQLSTISLISNRILVNAILLFTGVSSFILAAWLILKSLYQKSLASLTNEIKATRLKRNPEIFAALLEKQEANPINLPEPDEAIRFGNAAAPYQLVIACNPYCGPCAKAHQAIEHLYEKYPGQFSVAVRFALNKNDESDKRVITVKEIMKVAKTKPLESVKDWYSTLNLEKFKELHQTNGEQVDAAIDKHIVWSREADIKGTPTVFMNGRKLPELYSWVDFVETVEYEIKN
jgi:protein-disulfide isomerase/uncharacterized membrane protein